MRMTKWLTLALVAVPAIAGCLGGGDDDGPTTVPGLTSVYERRNLPFDTSSETLSRTLAPGLYDILTPGTQYFTSAGLEMLEGLPAALGADDVSLGVHFPDIPGCDWSATELPQHCRIPVIADAGPYYSATVGLEQLQTEGDAPVTEYTCGRLMCTLVDNFVPHGYAVAAVSVMGTGDSGHCMDLMGDAEQAGLDAAVEFLGTQPWSNGAVALIGRSYDGSTPWEAAMTGNPHLKTIVPISGLQGQHDLMWRNGSAEFRGPGVLWALYAAMTIDGDVPADATQVLCPDYLLGAPEGAGAFATGDYFADDAYGYWSERYFFDAVVENYNGSIYYVHGLQDWNVDSHQAFPYYDILRREGFDVKGLFGQWAHMYPDRRSEHDGLPDGRGGEAFPQSVRYDWAQDLLEWFDHYLKGVGPQPPLWVEVQSRDGMWRVEETYPPSDIEWIDIDLADFTGATGPVVGPTGLLVQQNPLLWPQIELTSPAFEHDVHISGNVRLPLDVTPLGPGGQVFAELRNAAGERLGHAIMDLRFAAGGKESVPVVPGQQITAHLEFFAIDAFVPAGETVRLLLGTNGEDYLPSIIVTPVQVDGGVLRLPHDPDTTSVFVPPVWYDVEEA
jgi:predicted acyl esterase